MKKKERKAPISHFTLNELALVTKGDELHGLQSECMVAETDADLQAFHFPCRIDALIIGIGTEGTATVSCNLQECRLRKNTLFCFAPNTILQIASSAGFRAHVAVVSTDFVRNTPFDLHDMMPVLLERGANPALQLDEAKSRIMQSFISLIEQEVHAPEQLYSREVVRGLLTSMIYKICDILQSVSSARPDESKPRNRGEAYFRRFTELLGEHYRKERCVSFYAQQLCITPKYLTTVIKRVSGSSVSDWVDRYVILEAKTLLKHSHMSIQEIAYSLNFANQSFFGSYFKRITGLSPTQYKNSTPSKPV
ncbi:MAG: AraC family transcriptional regulator [Alistipes sp.]|nr:AraC family transcriptional regulator [Alistipes sp.]